MPNSEAVKILGCNQPKAESKFEEMLTKATDRDNSPPSALGMLVSGDFGSGKSHPAYPSGTPGTLPRFRLQQGGHQQGNRPFTTWARCSSRRWTTAGCLTAAAD